MEPTILTVDGNYFDFRDPWSGPIKIRTIAHALSHICRFTGHTRKFYSVAQHSVMVSYIVPQEHALAGLLHDATEAFVGDVSAPLKHLLPDYRAIEKRVETAVLIRFGLSPELPKCVKHADLVMLATEQRDIMNCRRGDEWSVLSGIRPLNRKIRPWPIWWARLMFVFRYWQLTRQSSW